MRYWYGDLASPLYYRACYSFAECAMRAVSLEVSMLRALAAYEHALEEGVVFW